MIKKTKKLFYKLQVVLGDFETNFPAIFLKAYISMSCWENQIKSLKAVIDVEKSLIIIGNKTIISGFWPEPSVFAMNALCAISSKVSFNIPIKVEVIMPIKHNKLNKKNSLSSIKK